MTASEDFDPELSADLDAEIEADFEPVKPGPFAINALFHGERKATIARQMRLSRVALGQALSSEVTRRAADLPTEREAAIVLHAGLDDIVQRAYAALDGGGYVDPAPLLAVLNDALRIRAALTARESRR